LIVAAARQMVMHVDALAAWLDRSRGDTLAIALGANLPGPAGAPVDTLLAVRPLLADLLDAWAPGLKRLHWSPLFRTAPLGGPEGQPDYLNAVVLLPQAGRPQVERALVLLAQLQQLEQRFGRVRAERWGPRSLDLDVLWWADLQCDLPTLTLPHPRWRERGFVLAPLLALQGQPSDGLVVPPWPAELPIPLPGCPGWPD
jgi:2-amino-4-hydroxy-6-hydroxymethyldihydropteridine diphosphokinase